MENISKAFVTQTSGDGKPYIKIQFQTLDEMHAGFAELSNAVKAHSTSPSPAEVSSEGLPDFEAVRDKRLSEMTPAQREDAKELWIREQIGWMPDYRRKHYEFLLRRINDARQALSQQSPARVEGELTFDIIEELLPEGVLANNGGMIVSAQMLHDFAYRIERALNQRLAVKEGKFDSLLSEYVEAVATGGEVGEAYDKLCGCIGIGQQPAGKVKV